MAEATFKNDKGQEGKLSVENGKLTITAPIPDGFDMDEFTQKAKANSFCGGCSGVTSGFSNFMN